MRSIALLIVILASIPIIMLKPHVGVLVWSWLSYMNPHRLTWGFTQNFGFAQIIGAVTILAWLLSKEPKKIPLTPVTAFMIAFVVWMSWTTVFALVPDDAFQKWVQVMKIMAITFLTLPLIQTRQRLDALVWVIVVSIGFYGVKGGFFVLVTGGEYLVWGPPNSFIAANNSLALALIMVIPLMRYLQLQARSVWLRWAWLGAMGLCGLAVLSTYSRGAFLAMIAMLFYMWLKSSHRIVLGVIGALCLVAAVAFMPDKWTQRIETIQTYEQDGSAMGRLAMWRFGFNVAKDRPFFGGGFEIFPAMQYYERYGMRICEPGEIAVDCTTKARSSHSIYFEVLGEHGFVGLFLFLGIGWSALLAGNWVRRRTRKRADLRWAFDLATMAQVSMIGYAVGGLFLNRAYFDLYYHVVAIMVVTRLIVSRALAAEPAPAGKAATAATGSSGPGGRTSLGTAPTASGIAPG